MRFWLAVAGGCDSRRRVTTSSESLPSDLAAAHAMILAERAARLEAEAVAARASCSGSAKRAASAKAEAANAQADLSSTEALIAHLKLEIEKLRRQLYGTRSERKARLLEQMELQLEELEAAATEDELAAEKAAAQTQTVRSFAAQAAVAQAVPRASAARARRDRRAGELSLLRVGQAVEAGRGRHRDAGGDPAPVEGDPDGAREVLVPGLRDDHAAAGALPCHAARLCRPEPAGHDPVREVRPASAAEPPERALSRARASISACRRWPTRSAPATVALQPLHALIERHVLAAERLHGDDTTVPILAKGKTVTGRIWTYVRDDRPFGGRAPPAALYYASRDRRRRASRRAICTASPASCRPMPIAATTALYDPIARPGADHGGAVLGHARRQFFELADIAANARRGKNADGDLAGRAGGGQAHRCAVRHRARASTA